MLGEAAHWEESSVWVKREFELLRLAALAANRPGHFLLVQTLERSFWTMAGRVLPLLDHAAISRWGLCAFLALEDRDAQRLKRELPALLQSSDERVFSSRAPSHEEYTPPPVLHGSANQHLERSVETEPERAELSATVHLNRSACQTSPRNELPEAEVPAESHQGGLPDAAVVHRTACQTSPRQEPPESDIPYTPPERQSPDTVVAHWSTCQTRSREELPESGLSCAPPERQWPDTIEAHRSTCQTRSCQALQEEPAHAEGSQHRLPAMTVGHRSACQTCSCQTLPARDFESAAMHGWAGGASGRRRPEANGVCGVEEDWRAQTGSAWSPMPWARCSHIPVLPSPAPELRAALCAALEGPGCPRGCAAHGQPHRRPWA